MTACCMHTLSVAVSSAHLFREEFAPFVSFTWNCSSWEFIIEALTQQELGLATIQTLCELWFGTGVGHFAFSQSLPSKRWHL